LKFLPPGVKDRKEADPRAEMLRVGGDGFQCGRTGGKQDFVDHLRILQGEGVELFGNRKHDMEVLDCQQFLLAPFDPLGPGRVLALRAMAIAARVIADALMRTVAALFPVSTEFRCPAGFNRTHDAQLLQRQTPACAVRGSKAAENVGHLQRRPGQCLARHLGTRFPGTTALFAGRWNQGFIERTHDSAHGLGCDGGVTRRRVDSAMTEQDLDGADIGAVL
jgi:hypothetical protein